MTDTNSDLATRNAPDFAVARKAMIDSQLRTSGVNAEYVLARMNQVPREDFVPEDQRALAYIDRSLPLGEGKAIPSPVVHGMMLSEAAPQPSDTALVVENGSGYFAELLGPLVKNVVTIDAADAAQSTIKGSDYSLIIVDGALEALSKGLEKSLTEGGRIVTGIVERGVTRLTSGKKIAGQVTLQPITDIGIPVLHDFDQPKRWSFA